MKYRRRLAAVLVVATTALASGCGCGEGVFDSAFPTQCSIVRDRATKVLSCDNVRTSRKEPVSVDARSTDDADTYTVCCNFGSRACAAYVCPKGKPDSACYRD